MQTREELIQAARDGRLVDGADDYGNRYYLDGQPLYGPDMALIESLFGEGVFTFDHADIDSFAERIPVRIREGH